jgi:hypothetical protein
MNELIEKFFQKDITEAEADKLEKLLLNSPECADQFNEMARAAYALTGLPAHQWHGKPLHLPHTGGLGIGLKILLFVTVALVGTAFWYFKPAKQSEIKVTTVAPTLPVAPSAKTLSVSRRLAGGTPSEIEADQLSVLVETTLTSLVTVQILDAKGNEVRTLFAGVLDPGQKSFQWDGLLKDGRAAPNGDYSIQVQKGSTYLLKKVRLEIK